MFLTGVLLAIYFAVVLVGAKFCQISDCKENFLSKNQTTIMKGLCCIIVILVHIPEIYSNKVQDLIGSFAYIAVTLYFLLSAYGLRFSFETKKSYINNFIRNRIIPLLIPFIAIVFLKYLMGFNPFIGGLKFVYVLMLFYAITYVSYKLNFSGGGVYYISRSANL